MMRRGNYVWDLCGDFMICYQQYVGQTVNRFSMRYSVHQGTWNKPHNQLVLTRRRYTVFHGILNAPPIHDSYCCCYQVLTFWIPVKINDLANQTYK